MHKKILALLLVLSAISAPAFAEGAYKAAIDGIDYYEEGPSSSSPVDLAQEVTGTLPIANGGTGNTSAATAITALGGCTGGDFTEVLTCEDAGGGSPIARFAAAPAAYLTDSSTDLSVTATGDDFSIGASATANGAKLYVLATDNQIALNIKGSSGGTADLFNARTNDGTIVAKIDADGDVTAKSFSTSGTALADDSFAGLTITLTAGENLAFGEVGYMKSDGKVWKADADALATMPALFVATAAISADATGVFGTQGYVRDDSAYNWTVGGRVYVSGTPGAVTQTAPTGQDDVIQKIGIGLTADILYFFGGTTEVEDSTT